MHQVIIAMGSNTLSAVHIQWATGWLSREFGSVRFSRTLWTPDSKGTGRWYMNRLCITQTTLSREEVERRLKQAEAATGRTKQQVTNEQEQSDARINSAKRKGTRRSQVTLDLDLMQYDDDRYHLNDWPRPYIQQLITDII